MTQKVVQTAKNIFAIPRLTPRVEQERRASVFGMTETGKTTILGLLEIICVDYANKTNKPGSKTKFRYLVQERTSGIRQCASELRKGMFPEKTPVDIVFEADFLMRWDGLFKSQRIIRLPFCETAGETFGKLLDRFQQGQYEISPQMEDAALIHDYILDTDAIVLIAPVTRPLGVEVEKGAKLDLPDVNLSRLLAGIYGYKMEDAQSNPNHRPIKGIACFLTKYDAVRNFLETKHMNLKTEEGRHAFMSKYFPETYAVLGWYGLENVRFWPTGVEVETEKNEMGQIVPKLHPLDPSRGWKIRVDHNRSMPKGDYEQQMYEFIDWLKSAVMA
uniref:Uncharacterized protein n=1 Tax=viral metagenome TaxID=1070528 RepID=A0A6M3Y5U8_9ZZZZ